MNYLHIKIILENTLVEEVLGILSVFDIDDFIIDDPNVVKEIMDKKQDFEWDYIDEKLENYMDDKAKIEFYREITEENKTLVSNVEIALKNRFKEDFNDTISFEISNANDGDWKDKWKEYFKPVKISENIVVKPTWEEYEKLDENEVVIEVDPGMAFGTGAHETTAMCVRLMEKYISKGDKVLDVGCGSGILSIAGSLLGAEEVLGVDIDEIAVDVSKENIEINKCSHNTKAQYGDLTKGIDFKADIIVANLTVDLVCMLAEHIENHLRGKKIFITTGILTEKQDKAIKTFEKLGFKIIEIVEDGDWCAIVVGA